MKRCYAFGPDCDGRVVAHHLVKKQRIRKRGRKPNYTLPPPKYAFAEGAEDGRTRWDNKP